MLKVFVLLTFLAGNYASVIDKCVLPLKPEYSFFAPLIFDENGALISTENHSETIEDISLNVGQEVLLSCTPNYFKEFDRDKTLKATCKGGNKLVVNNEPLNYAKKLSCEVRSIEEILTPVEGCSSRLRSIEYGFTNPITNRSYVLGEACYCTRQGKIIFAHTRLRSAGSRDDIEKLALRTGDTRYLSRNHPDSRYKIDLMKRLRFDILNQHFKNEFETDKVPSIGTKRFISEDLLTHKQFLPVTRLAWNYAVVSDEENLENFDLLQQDVLGLEASDVEIYVGTSGVMQWKGKGGKVKEVLLDEDKFPVPKYLWTVVKSKEAATALVLLNPSNVDGWEQDIFCQSRCEEISWLTNLKNGQQYKKRENGFVFCCSFDDFKKGVKEMPNIGEGFELLK